MSLNLMIDSYETVANVDAYHADRGNAAWAALDEQSKEVNIRKATDWIDRNHRFIGSKKNAGQRLAWPRVGAFDEDGYLVGQNDAPYQVKEACAIVADVFREGLINLDGIEGQEPFTKKVKVDVLEFEYEFVPPKVTKVNHMLRPLLASSYLRRA